MWQRLHELKVKAETICHLEQKPDHYKLQINCLTRTAAEPSCPEKTPVFSL